MKPAALALADVYYSYRLGDQLVPALNGITLSIGEGEMVAIQGPSGSGKSTLLYLLGCMLKPDRGDVRLRGLPVNELDEVQQAYLRNRQLGFVFQQFHLLPGTDVLNNILMPVQYPLEDHPEASVDFHARATELAMQLGLGERLHHTPHQLSGGQQQRVAIARALIRNAPIILADEPAGNLDSTTSKDILHRLRQLNSQGKTVVIITHDAEVAAQCDRTIWIRDGRVDQGNSKLSVEKSEMSDSALSIPQLGALGLKTLVNESLPRAWENLKRNRLRTFLTMLGVVVGVASILAMLTLGTFVKERILQSYATLGINTLRFIARQNWQLKAKDRPPNSFYELNMERDVEPLPRIFPEIKMISPLYSSHRHTAVFGGRSIEEDISVIGVNEDTFRISRRDLAVGSAIQQVHIDKQSSVCVVGWELAQKLFQREYPVGQAMQVGIDELTFSCLVIGVSKPVYSKETRFTPDMQILIPYTYFKALPFSEWNKRLDQLLIEIKPEYDVEESGIKLTNYFKSRYGRSGDFRGSSDSVLVAQMKRFLDLFTLLLVSIAGLSLIVGGMGITNMMLVSVNERLREIGLRKALGASHTAIRYLFFAESLFLCTMAGLIGMIVGFASYQGLIYLGSKLIPDMKYEWVFNPWAFLTAFVAIVVTGVLSGLGPAVRAERLQVIEALRSE